MSERPDGLIVSAGPEDVEVVCALAPAHRREIEVDVGEERAVVRTGPVGVHPLYLGEADGKCVLAATQSAAAEALGGLTVDPEELARTLADWRLAPERTIFRELRRLAPGTRVTVDLESGELSTERGGESLWSAATGLPERDRDRERLRELLGDRLEEVAGRSPEVGAALSGGLDSSTLVALLEERGAEPAVWMLEDGCGLRDEKRHAERLVERLELEARRVTVSPESLPGFFADAVRRAEGPIINPRGVSKYVFYLGMAEADAGPVVVGLGADEVFAGKPRAWSVDSSGCPGFAAGGRRAREIARSCLREEAAVEESCVPRDVGFGRLRRIGFEEFTRRLLFPLEAQIPASLGVDIAFPYLDRDVVRFASRLGRDALLGEDYEAVAKASVLRRPRRRSRCRSRDGDVPAPDGGNGWRPFRDSLDYGKVLLREAMAPALGEDAAWQPKRPVLQPPAGGDESLRQAWADLLDGWLTRRRLEKLDVVRPERVRALVEEYATADLEAEHFPALERTLMQLASVAVRVDALVSM